MTTRQHPEDQQEQRARAPAFVALAPRSAVALRRSACLRTRRHDASCTACADACPVRALSCDRGGVALAAGCTGCGRCRAACPTGALFVEGFDVSEPPPPGAGTLVLDCRRFGGAARSGDALRVPCLGGLSASDLLWLCAGAPERTVLIAERAACRDCDSGGAAHPAAAAVEAAAALMREARVPEERLPRLDGSAVVATPRAAAGDDPLQSRGRARRGFFAAFAPPATQPPRAAAGSTSPRRRLVAALEVLAARHGRPVPASVFHRLEVGPQCAGHRVCAAACATGALARYRDERSGRVGIAFDSRDCIGCGQCTALCPGQALSLRLGRGSALAGQQPLTGFVVRECVDCSARFAVAANAQEAETRCDRCRRSARLARSAYATLFSARP